MVQVGTRFETDYASEIEKVFLDHHEMVYRAAYRITGNAADAEDALQTLFLRLARREWIPDPEHGWPAYLRRAAINIALDIVRTRRREARLDDCESPPQESRPDPHRQHSASELRDRLAGALARLNPNAAEIFVLRYVEGCKLEDIARMLHTTRSSVAVTLFRTRARLRKSMSEFLGGR